MQLAAFKASSDTSPPTAPTNLSATVISGTEIDLAWTASTDNTGVTGYRVERCSGSGCSNFVQVDTPTSTTYSDQGLTASTSYSYRVRAQDAAGNLSGYSATVSATTVAGGSTSIAFVQTAWVTPQTPQTSVSVVFDSAQTAGDLNVVAVGWSDSTSTVNSVTDSEGNTYSLAIGPTRSTGNASQSIYYAKSIVGAPAGGNTVTVTFNAAVAYPDVRLAEYSGLDESNPLDASAGASGSGTTTSSGAATTTNAVDLLVGANYVATGTIGSGSGYTQRDITTPDGDILEDQIVTAAGNYAAVAPQSPSGWWIMQMAAFKAAGAGGGDTQPPTAPSGLTASATVSVVNLSWTASTDNVGVTGYRVERCQGSGCSSFTQVGTATGTTFNDTGLSASTSYSYRLRATDAAGNLSGYSNTASATTSAAGDTTPPSAPTGLSASAGGSVVNLTWTASTDNVGVTGYQIERCQGSGCSSFAQVGTSTSASYTDGGLTASMTYNYRVRAIDAAGNLSGYSNTTTATTTAGLTAPTGLFVVAASSSEIDLAWGSSRRCRHDQLSAGAL